MKALSRERRASLVSSRITDPQNVALLLPNSAEFDEDLRDAMNVFRGLEESSPRHRRKHLKALVRATETWMKAFSRLDRFPLFAEPPDVYMSRVVARANAQWQTFGRL
jgi:hypothetical protein